MNIRELIQAELDKLTEEDLVRVLRLLRDFSQSKASKRPGFMERLMQIQIEAPADFSVNFDKYASGEKKIEDNM